MADRHVDITLVHPRGRTDLRIPTRVSVRQLIAELAAIFPGLDAGLRRYQLRVAGTGLLLTEEDVLADHPVATGDVVHVVGAGPA